MCELKYVTMRAKCVYARVKIYVCEREMHACERSRINYVLYGPSYLCRPAHSRWVSHSFVRLKFSRPSSLKPCSLLCPLSQAVTVARWLLTPSPWLGSRRSPSLSHHRFAYDWDSTSVILLSSHWNHRRWWSHALIQMCLHPESQPPGSSSIQPPPLSVHRNRLEQPHCWHEQRVSCASPAWWLLYVI